MCFMLQMNRTARRTLPNIGTHRKLGGTRWHTYCRCSQPGGPHQTITAKRRAECTYERSRRASVGAGETAADICVSHSCLPHAILDLAARASIDDIQPISCAALVEGGR